LARNQDNVSEQSNMSADCCLSELNHYKNPTKCVGLVQSGHHLIHRNATCSLHDIAENLLT